MTDEPIPLTPEDRAILDLESATVAGHTCKVILVDGPAPEIGELRESISERLSNAPALTWKLGGPENAPAWVVAEDFDVSKQVGEGGVAPLDKEDLRTEVARLFERRLERDRPLWHLDVLPMDDGGAALVWRIHHALADGTAAMRFASAVLWDLEATDAVAAKSHAQAHAEDDARRRGHLVKFVEREFGETFRHSPFDARIGTNRAIAFASVELAALHDAAKSLAGATVNDAVLTIAAGGLRAWLEHHGGPLRAVRMKVPVSLHHEGDDAANRDSFFELAVRLDEADPVARLAAVHAATATRKTERDAERLDSLLEDLRRVSPHLEHLCKRIEANPRRFALSVSNVPGPRSPVSVLGSPVGQVYSLAEIGRRHALRVAAVSLAGLLCFGFCADPAVVEDLDEMARGLEADAAALIAAAG